MILHIFSARHPGYSFCEIPRRFIHPGDDDTQPCELCFELANDSPDIAKLSRIMKERSINRLNLRRGGRLVRR